VSDIHALVGAYAVDALDDDERAAFERHLAGCAECRAEVASLREAAGQLAETTATEPPAELRDRVLAGISTVRPLPPVVEPLAAHRRARRARRVRLAALAAAAAVVAAVGVGGAVLHPWSDDTSQVTPSAVDAVLAAPDARTSKLDFDNGASATVTHSDSLGEAVLQTRRMPPPPPGKVYQLWLDQPGVGMVPAGLMKQVPDQTVLLEGDAATATAAGITVEPPGGSTSPTSDPIALFDFGKKA
jgi:anti-sigma-K factor RskA